VTFVKGFATNSAFDDFRHLKHPPRVPNVDCHVVDSMAVAARLNCFIKDAEKGADCLCAPTASVSYLPGDTIRMIGRERLSTKDGIDNEKGRARG
jgi:hypothetical protein